MTTEAPLVATLGSGLPEQITSGLPSALVFLTRMLAAHFCQVVHLEYFKESEPRGVHLGVVSTEKEVLVIGLNKVSYKVSQLSLSRNI